MRELCINLGVPFVSFSDVLLDPSWIEKISRWDEQLLPQIPAQVPESLLDDLIVWESEERQLVLTAAGREMLEASDAEIDDTSWHTTGLMVSAEHLSRASMVLHAR